MVEAKRLVLIAVSEGSAGDFRWISMGGPAETRNACVFVDTFPHKPCVVLDGDFSQSPQMLTSLIAGRIGEADVCLLDSNELLAFTKNEEVYREILIGRD